MISELVIHERRTAERRAAALRGALKSRPFVILAGID
jgi:hypothetical protein